MDHDGSRQRAGLAGRRRGHPPRGGENKGVPAGTPMTLGAVKKAGVPVFAYGNFITIALNFLILAFIIFLMVKQFNRLKAAPPAPTAPPEDVLLLREIRASLK